MWGIILWRKNETTTRWSGQAGCFKSWKNISRDSLKGQKQGSIKKNENPKHSCTSDKQLQITKLTRFPTWQSKQTVLGKQNKQAFFYIPSHIVNKIDNAASL